jgi:hypothetical protein
LENILKGAFPHDSRGKGYDKVLFALSACHGITGLGNGTEGYGITGAAAGAYDNLDVMAATGAGENTVVHGSIVSFGYLIAGVAF